MQPGPLGDQPETRKAKKKTEQVFGNTPPQENKQVEQLVEEPVKQPSPEPLQEVIAPREPTPEDKHNGQPSPVPTPPQEIVTNGEPEEAPEPQVSNNYTSLKETVANINRV